ncbi:MAG: hypothetical protein AAFQ43_00270 [Bacteroidota bacterium]
MSTFGAPSLDQLATERSILSDVHTRAGKLARAKNDPQLATSPDEEDRLKAHLRQASREIAVETGRLHVTVELDVSADTSTASVPGILSGSRIAQATWSKEGGTPRPLAVEHLRFDQAAATAQGEPTILRVGPSTLALDTTPSVGGVLAVSGVARSGYTVDGDAVSAGPGGEPGISLPTSVEGEAIHPAFPKELARCAAFLVLREHFDELGQLDLATHFESRAMAEIERFRPDTRQTGFARAKPRPFG